MIFTHHYLMLAVLTFDDLYKLDVGTCMYDGIQKPLSAFRPNSIIHSHDTRQKYYPHVQPRQSVVANNLLLHKAPTIWNSFPQIIREISTRRQFKRALKKPILAIWCDWWSSVYLPRPRRELRGIVFTRSVCVCVCVCMSVCLSVCVYVCPANILIFYFSTARRDIDLHRSKVKVTGRYITFWRYSHITKTEP